MQPPQQPRSKIPKDGLGPRGAPDCYYTSRVLNSTYRYVKFVKKLRAEEEEQRKGALNELKEHKDKTINAFFIKCDRKSLINNVARRVDLCMTSYQEDLRRKRARLMEMISKEEEANIRKFVEQAQAGIEAVWQDKKDRLQYLLAARKKEHEEKYKDTPLSKCVHVQTCVFKMRAREAQEIQLYQIKEKEAKKMAEIEFNKMWHEVTMKESEALAARMEQDAIERFRNDMECKQFTDYQVEQKRIQREKEREMLKQETLRFKSIWEKDIKNEEEAERKRVVKRLEAAGDIKKMIEERQVEAVKRQAEEQQIADTWDTLTKEGIGAEKAKEELRRRKERELDECNRKLIQMKAELNKFASSNEEALHEEARRQQQLTDDKRCQYILWSQKTNRDVRKAMVDQINDRQKAREVLTKKVEEENEYHRQLFTQLQELVDYKQMENVQTRKKHQNQLLEQIEYNKLLKERARQEELDQIKKSQIATEEYKQEIQRMMNRPFFSDEIHPFMKQMAKGLQMKEKCPCSKPDYCK